MSCVERRAEAKKRIWILHSEDFASRAQSKEATTAGYVRAEIARKRTVDRQLIMQAA
jgi:hypothetical protein